ncbi:MAG: von Willebrand factor type A domain-containing protein [Candidatus Cryptobacteroides sp.]
MNFRICAAAVACLVTASCTVESFDAMYDNISGFPEYEESGDRFSEIKENDFIKTSVNNQSTFSIDADGAAYAYMRRNVRAGRLPDANSVRIEEYLNYFTFNYPDPENGQAVAINGEFGPCPWTPSHRLLRLGIKGRSLEEDNIPNSNYVFLVDVSGSMYSDDKLGLLKKGLISLVDNLRPDDRVSIVTYSGTVQRILGSTPVSEAGSIKEAISKLTAGGSTAGGAAMKMAYEEAVANYIEGGNNRVVMGTDGDFNVGVTSTDELLEMAEDYAAKGIYLTVCGFGTGNLNDSMMETVSGKGNGTYEYIDCEEEMVKVFVNEVSKFHSIANDAKVQVTFDPERVESYRLIGYENRLLSNEDFENDRKDAGEIGAGQTITALYEIIPGEAYEDGGDAAVFDFRYKESPGASSIPLTLKIKPSSSISDEFNFAAGIAAYGLVLFDSKYKGAASFEMAYELSESGLGFDPYHYREQFRSLVLAARKITR